MHLTTTGIVLREVDYKESDKILTVLTRDKGKLTVSARGCRRKNSGIAAVSQLLCYSELTLYEYQNRWSIREGDILREFRGVRGNLDKLSLGAWFAELTESLTGEDIPGEDMLRLLLNALYALEEMDLPAEQIKAVFELRMMALAGYEPVLDGCVVCGKEEPEAPRFHLQQGALHCRSCRAQMERGISMPLDRGSLAAMRHVFYGGEKKIFSFRISGASQQMLDTAAEAYVLTQLERGFRTLDFYKQMQGLSLNATELQRKET